MNPSNPTATTWLRRLPWAIALLVLAWPLTPLPMRAFINDDALIGSFIAGGEDPVFTGVLLARSLRWLYRLTGPDFPWYHALLLLCLAVSSGVCTAILLRTIPPLRRPVFGTLALLGFGAVFSLFPLLITFTLAATALATSGIWLLMTATARPSALAAGALFGLGLWVRTPAALLAPFLCVVPLFAWFLRTRDWRRALLFAAPPLLMFAAETAANRWTFTPAHAAYVRFNDLRGQMHGFPVFTENETHPAALAAAGWTATDSRLFSSWWFQDERRFNERSLRAFLDVAGAQPRESFRLPSRERLAWALKSRRDYFLHCGLLALLAIAAARPVGRWALLAHAGSMTAWGLYLDLFHRLPPRVQEPIHLAMFAGTLTLLFFWPPESRPGRANRLAALLAVVFLAWRGSHLLHIAGATRWDQREAVQSLRELDQHLPGGIVFLWPEGNPNLDVLHPFRPPRLNLRLKLYGSFTFSEIFYRELREVWGISRGQDLLPAILRRTDVYFAGPDDAANLLIAALREGHGLEASVHRLEPAGGFNLWTLRPSPAQPP